MKITHSFSAWATRHPRQAIPFIILLEFANAVIGIMVGSALLKNFSAWVLMGLILGVVVINVTLKRYAHIRLFDLVSQARFGFQKQVFFCLFCLNLCIYTIAGGIMGRVITHPEASSNLYGSLTTTSAISESSSDDKKISFREKMRQKAFKRVGAEKGDVGRRIGYIVLFLLGVALAYIGAILACNLACSGIGFGAVLVLLLSTGILAGGFYFLGRGVDKNMKPYKEMTRDERKREGRRYLRTLLGTIGGMALLILISSLSGN
jgi:hypothetical protein